MAYDESLAQRLRDKLTDPAVTERKMFGGLAFFTNGNMTVGVSGDELIVRLGPEGVAAALERAGVRPFESGGRFMRGWILVAGDRLDDPGLDRWLAEAIGHVTTLPPKESASRAKLPPKESASRGKSPLKESASRAKLPLKESASRGKLPPDESVSSARRRRGA